MSIVAIRPKTREILADPQPVPAALAVEAPRIESEPLRIPVGLRLQPGIYNRFRHFALDRNTPIAHVVEAALEAYMGAER